jgi:hypothetical protein
MLPDRPPSFAERVLARREATEGRLAGVGSIMPFLSLVTPTRVGVAPDRDSGRMGGRRSRAMIAGRGLPCLRAGDCGPRRKPPVSGDGGGAPLPRGWALEVRLTRAARCADTDAFRSLGALVPGQESGMQPPGTRKRCRARIDAPTVDTLLATPAASVLSTPSGACGQLAGSGCGADCQ